MVVFVRTGVKAPVHRTLGIAKSKTRIIDVIDIDAGMLVIICLVTTAPINFIMFRLRDFRSR
jgi:hypothetical protein